MRTEDFDQLPGSVRDYLQYIDVIKAKSSQTVCEYASDLRLFFRYTAKSKGLVPQDTPLEKIDVSKLDIDFMKSVTLNDAFSFIIYCKDKRGNNATTRARKVVSIRRFFDYLYNKQHLIDTNPMSELESPDKKKTLPKYLTLEQSLDLLGCIDGKNKERDYCIITLFLNCGMRLSELVSLNVSDIKDDNTVKITGKGNKERTVYLNDACMSAIEKYLKVRPVYGVKDKKALFISRNMRRINPRSVENIVYHFLNKAGLDGYSVHKLRHTAATLMYQHGNVDILLIKSILGHENLSTTEIYTHVVNEQLREAVNSNPLNNVKKTETDPDR
ncbi:MAG: tyrosine recombinase XerC [Clostridiales bacterium]|nr:tyrosine recombinase XerC [Clostridiales bacterium]